LGGIRGEQKYTGGLYKKDSPHYRVWPTKKPPIVENTIEALLYAGRKQCGKKIEQTQILGEKPKRGGKFHKRKPQKKSMR